VLAYLLVRFLRREKKWRMKFAVHTVTTLLPETIRRWSSKVAAKQSVFKRAVRTVESTFSSSSSQATCSIWKLETSFSGLMNYYSRLKLEKEQNWAEMSYKTDGLMSILLYYIYIHICIGGGVEGGVLSSKV
jgi:hypothetical protein